MNPFATDHSEVTPLLDLTQLETFIDLGLTDFLDLMNDVTRELPDYVNGIHAAIREENQTALKSRAHSMRGMLANFGCVAMTGYLYQLEHGGSVQSNQADPVRADLENLWALSLAAIKEWEKSVPGFMP